MKPNPICFPKQEFRFENEGKRDFENYLKKGVRKILIVKEFLLGNVQIRFKNQGLLYKTSSMELRTPHETQPYLFYQTKIQI